MVRLHEALRSLPSTMQRLNRQVAPRLVRELPLKAGHTATGRSVADREHPPAANNPRVRERAERHDSALMVLTRPIEVDGVTLGAAVAHVLGVRFIALDPRVADMNESIWPNFSYARSSARQLFRSSRAPGLV